jgi:hypothetical protein
MHSIAFESKSMITDSDCEAGQCNYISIFILINYDYIYYLLIFTYYL